MENNRKNVRRGVLDVVGAHCPSCAFTIEKLGRKVPGVSEVRVDVARHEILVDHDGRPGALEGVADIVGRLGYRATVRGTRENGAAPVSRGRDAGAKGER